MRTALLLTALLLAAAAPAAARPRSARLRAVHTWAFAIGSRDLAGSPAVLARRYRGYDLVVVDGEAASRAQIRALRRGGRVVLAYLDVGSIESYRSWYPRAKPYRLDFWGDWGEWFARTSAPGYRRLMARDVAPKMLAKGWRALRRLSALGLLVTATDYVRRGDRAATASSVRDACAAGALPFVSDIGLSRVPVTPFRCP